MTPIAFSRDVKRAYGTFDEADYQKPLDLEAIPSRAKAQLTRWANPDLDVAEFRKLAVDGRPTYAAYVPSSTSGDVFVVSASGKALAKGTVENGSTELKRSRRAGVARRT